MGIFTALELTYLLGERSDAPAELVSRRRLGRLATVGPDGMPHVVPVGWSLDPESQAIEIGGSDFGNSKKFHDVSRTGRAALVVDDVQPPWKPRGVEIRGTAEAIARPRPMIRIHPTRVISWGLEAGKDAAVRTAHDVTRTQPSPHGGRGRS